MFNTLELMVSSNSNNNSIFFQQEKEEKNDLSLENLKEILEKYRKIKFNEVIFTGGEPTLRKDIFEMIKYSKEIGYKFISIKTNGRMFSYQNFAEKMLSSGLTDSFIYLNGHNSKIHDSITMTKNSFEQTIKGISNLRKLNHHITIICFLCKKNYKYLKDILEFLIGLGIRDIQFKFIEGNKKIFDNYKKIVPKFSEIEKYLYESAIFAKDNKLRISIEGIPFCLMKDFENLYYNSKISKSIKIGNKNNLRRKIKPEICNNCEFNSICDGVPIYYLKKYGNLELKPIRLKMKYNKIKKLRDADIVIFPYDIVQSTKRKYKINFLESLNINNEICQIDYGVNEIIKSLKNDKYVFYNSIFPSLFPHNFVSEIIRKTCFKEKKLFICGEHWLSSQLILKHLKNNPNDKIIIFDAHLDYKKMNCDRCDKVYCYDDYIFRPSEKNYINFGIDRSNWLNFLIEKIKNPSNIIHIGSVLPHSVEKCYSCEKRSFCEGDKSFIFAKFMKEIGVNIFPSFNGEIGKLNENGVSKLEKVELKKIVKDLNGSDCYISVDIDAFPMTYGLWSVGTLNIETLNKICNIVNIKSADINEISDPSGNPEILKILNILKKSMFNHIY